MERDASHLMKKIVEPLSFSTGCLESSHKNGDSSLSSSTRDSPFATNSLNRRKVKYRTDRSIVRKSWDPSDKDEGSQEFWASIREPYDFIMGTHLISDSTQSDQFKEKNVCDPAVEMELSWDTEDVSPAYVWSLSEFLDQYNELYEWLIQVQLKLYSHSNPPDKQSRLAQQDELVRHSFRRKLFVEQGESVAEGHPEEREEIEWRVSYLNNKWEQLQSTLTPLRGRVQEVEVELDLAHEEELLCSWLVTMEKQIQPLTCRLSKGCSVHALQERYKDNQILQKDIEAHGPILKSVLRQYERLASAGTDPSRSPLATPQIDTAQSPSPNSVPPSPSVATPPAKGKSKSKKSAVPRRAKSLEKRWHQIYLRSLEWHYYLEGVIANFKERNASSSSSDSEDEPVTKCRRLSGSSVSSSSSATVSRPRRKPRPRQLFDHDVSSSEAGSYIEDDYVHVTTSERTPLRGARNRKALQSSTRKPKCVSSKPDNSSPMVGVEAVSSEGSMDAKVNNNLVLNENEKNRSAVKAERFDNIAAKKDVTDLPPVATSAASLKVVNRPSPNSGVFDCKHYDTDSDNNNVEYKTISIEEEIKEESTVMVQKRYRARTSTLCRKMDYVYDEEVDPEALQEIIDSAILDQDWLNSNITDTEGSLIEDEAHVGQMESMDTESEENLNPNEVKEVVNGDQVPNGAPAMPSKAAVKPCAKESIHRLISDAEQLVRDPLMDPSLVSPRAALKPLPFGVAADTKQRRIKRWLSCQDEDGKFGGDNSLQDSCDASGELTTGESDIESSENELDVSTATQKNSTEFLLSSENTPTVEALPSLLLDQYDKVILRGKKRLQYEQRPWSVSDAQLMTPDKTASDDPKTPVLHLDSSQKSISPRNVLSSSESALNRMQSLSSGNNDQTSISQSDPMVFADPSANNPSSSCSHPRPAQSPTITSTTTLLNISSSTSHGQGRTSPTLVASGNMRRRRAKFRRRSNQFLGRRTDSGSDELNNSKTPKNKDSKGLVYSPYHYSLTKTVSSESESVSGCPRVAKSSSQSGGCTGQTGGMTSSTEKCLSDSSLVSDSANNVTRISLPVPELPEESASGCPTPRSVDGSLILSPRKGISDQEASNPHEDVSSLSEQAWDPYQEFKYLSEPYSEDIDNDAARRLLDFGDDYSKYMDSDGSSLRGFYQRQQQQQQHQRRRRSPHHRKPRPNSYHTLDSDSDLDDLHHVIEESKSQLSAMESVLHKYSNQATLGLDFGELVTTANTNLKCLQDILRHLEMEAPDLKSEFNDVRSIVERWDSLQKKAVERQRQSTQLRQLQRQVKGLRLGMEGVGERAAKYAHPHTLDDAELIPTKVNEVKILLEETESLRCDLSSLNVMVHRFTSDVGSSFTPLKDEMAELYRIWDETHRRVSGELTRLQSAESTWRLWEEQKNELYTALKQDSETLKVIDAAIDNGSLTELESASVHDVATLLNERRIPSVGKTKSTVNPADLFASFGRDSKSNAVPDSKEDRLSDSGTSGYESCSSDDLSERERRLAYLRRLARDLEASLVPGSKAWNDISATLANAEKELHGLQDHCRNLVLRTAESLDPSTKQLRFSSNSNKRRNWSRESKGPRSPRQDRKSKSGCGYRRDWVRRVVRAALPFQAALLLLLCVACLLEPNCCDSVNTLHLSFTPQLRFVHGSPPI